MIRKQQRTKRNQSTQQPKVFKNTLKRLTGYLGNYKLSLLIVVFTAFLSTTFMILSPVIMGLAITEIFEGMAGEGIDYSVIFEILLLLGALYLLSSYFAYVQEYTMVGVAQKLVYTLRKEINEKLSKLPLRFYDTRTHGDILSRAVNDLEKISSTLQQTLTQFITAFITLVGVTIIMLFISPLMTLIVFITLPLGFIITKKIVARSQHYFKGQQKALGELNGHVEEMYSGHPAVKAFGREQQSVYQFQKMNAKLYESGWKAQFISSVITPLLSFVSNIVYVAIAVVGSIFVTQQAMTIGNVQAFILYVRQFSQPINRVANISNIIQSTIAAAERVFEILDEEEEIEGQTATRTLPFPKGDVDFERVSFGYQKDQTLIEDNSFQVKRGQTVAIVGPTGAGKTTLMNLLLRFYDIDTGRISIDGIDIREMHRNHLRHLFGFVLQDTWLFNGTIRDNIAYGVDHVTDAKIVQAAEAAHADHFIRTLSDGYETVLNEGTSNVSQGQKQLLTIARAIIADPKILVLDEATSNVDTRTERHIQEALQWLMKGRTSFIIAHRLSTIRDADLILVMKQGKIIDQGSHAELLTKGGFYKAFHDSQFTADEQKKKSV